MIKQSTIATIVLLAVTSMVSWGETSVGLSASPGNVRVLHSADAEGVDRAEIDCAKNETESFQVFVRALGGDLQRVNVEMTELQNERGDSIPNENVWLFHEICVPVRNSSPRSIAPTGLYPDPLVPFIDAYTGEKVNGPRWDREESKAVRFSGSGFDIHRDQHETVWIDVCVPKDARAGTYRAEVNVRARGGEKASLPVTLTVWNFTLPDGPTHENHFGGFSYIARYYDVQRDSERYRLLEDRFIEMMARHRINPPIPARLQPKTGDDGSIVLDPDFEREFAQFIQQYHLTNIQIPRAPFRDVLSKDRDKAIQFYRSWYAFLARRGWEKGAYLYMLDEPNDAEAYERVRDLGALVKEAEPRVRRVVVEQPYTQNPEWGTLNDAIDIWCPLFSFIDEGRVNDVIENGDEVWSYSALVQSAPRYHPNYERVKNDNPPYWQIDFPVMGYRIAPWLNRRYNVTGLLYWSTVYWRSPDRNPWDDPGFRTRFNGDGFLFYPGEDVGIEGPVASIRLKNLRDGMEDYEYFVLLEQLGGKKAVNEIVRECVPTWGTWEQNPSRFLDYRQRLAKEILNRQ